MRDNAAVIEDELRRRREKLLLGEPARYTRRQVSELAGVDFDRAQALWKSMGFPETPDDDVAFTDADVEALRLVTSLRTSGVLNEATEEALARSQSQAVSKLAETQLQMLSDVVVDALPPDADQTTVAETATTLAENLLPIVEQLQGYLWRRHTLAAGERLLAHGTAATDTPQVVGFADVVGYTSLSRGLDPDRLSAFLESFESTASALVTDHGGRVVKTIGDEIMFVADTASDGAEIGLALSGLVSEFDGRPNMHVGLAYGPVVQRFGDVFGTVVNMASRLTSVSRPGSVLVDQRLADELSGTPEYRLRTLRRVNVRGFRNLQPVLLRRRSER